MRKNYLPGLKERLLEAYKAKNISSLSRLLGIANSTLDGYVKGTSDIPTAVLMRFSEDTGVSVHWLLTGGGEKFPEIESHEESVFAFILRKGGAPPRLVHLSDPKLLMMVRKILSLEVQDDGSRRIDDG